MDPHSTTSPFAELADLVTSIGRELHARHSDADDVVPLTGTEALVLRHVDRHPGSSPSATADATGLHRSNLSTALRVLEGRGLVERTTGAHDGRSVELRTTGVATDSIGRLRAHWDEQLRAALGATHESGDDRAAEDDVRRAVELLRRLEAGLASQRSPAPR